MISGPVVESQTLTNHITISAFAALLILGGGCVTHTVSVEPVHVAVDATVTGNGTGPGAPGPTTRLVEMVGRKLMGPGTLTGDLSLGCVAFYQRTRRWPRTLAEVEGLLREGGQSAESFRTLETVDFKSLANGDLEVTYRAAGPVEGSVHLTKPKD